jgi:hypothetical protein
VSDVIAGVKVRLQADDTGLKAEAEKQVNAAVPEFKDVKLSLDTSALNTAAMQAKDALAATRREIADIQKKLADLGAARRQAETAGGPLLEAFNRQQAEFAKNPDPTKDEAPLRARAAALADQLRLQERLAAATASAANAAIDADIAAAAASSDVAAARVQEAKATDLATAADKRHSGIGGFIRAGAAGRSGGLAGLLGAGARLGAVGFAATAAFQAVGELQQSLRVTGDEAFTAEGKLRNLGAELLGGNIIGGIKALAAERKAVFEGDLGAKLEEEMKRAKEAADPLAVTEEKLAAVRQKGAGAVNDYIKVLLAFGAINLEQAVALAAVNKKLDEQAKLADAGADSWANYQAAVEKAGSELKAFGPDSRGGPRGVGGVNAGRPTASNPAFVAGTGGPDVAAQIRASINSRIQDEQVIASARVREAKITQKIAKDSFDTAKSNVLAGAAAANSGAAAWKTYVEATTGVVLATQNATNVAKAAAEAGQQLGNAVRDARVAAIADPNAQASGELDAQRIRESQAKAKFEAAKKGTKEANDAYGAWQIEKFKTVAVENSIAATAKAAAQAAAQSAKSAKEQGLQNDIAAAELIGDTPRLKRAYRAAIAYWNAIAHGTTQTAEAREAAEANVIALTASLKATGSTASSARLQNNLAEAELKGFDTRPFLTAIKNWAFAQMNAAKVGTEAYETLRGTYLSAAAAVKTNNQTLNNLKLANAEAKALLTETTSDEEKLYKQQVAYWKRRVAQTKGEGVVHQNAVKEELAWEAKLKGLTDQIKPTTTVFDLLTKATSSFVQHAGNVINASSRFDADSFTGGIRNQIGTTPNAAGRARLGLDSGGLVGATNNNTSALDRLTIAIKGLEPRGHPPAAGATSISGGGGGSWGGAGWVEARDARDARSGIN